MAFLYGTPAGVVGSVSRPIESFVDTVKVDSSFTNYGQFGAFDATSGVFKAIASGATAVDGLLIRSVPQITGSLTSAFNQVTPNSTYAQGRLTRGYAMVSVATGTPVKGQPVYVRITASTGKAVGDIVTAAETISGTASTLLIPNCEFASNGKDGSGIAEILIKA